MQKRKAVTLIELLIVVAVILLMAGLLLVSIQRVRLHADNLKCKSNLRQIGIAMHTHADVNAGLLPAHQGPDWMFQAGQYVFWFGEMSADGSVVDASKGTLSQHYEGTLGTQCCPRFLLDVTMLPYKGQTRGYGYNGLYLSHTKLSDVSYSSATIAFTDSAWVDVIYGTQQLGVWEMNIIVPPSGKQPTVHFRHDGFAHVLFVDGHVEQVLPTKNEYVWSSPEREVYNTQQNIWTIGIDDELWKARR